MRRNIFTFAGFLLILIPSATTRAQQETQAQRDATVNSIQILPGQPNVLVGERVYFMAVALDVNAVPVGGVAFSWSAVDSAGKPAAITQTGIFKAPSLGTFQITTVGAGKQASTTTTVVPHLDGYEPPPRWTQYNYTQAFNPRTAVGEPVPRRPVHAHHRRVSPDPMADPAVGSSNFQFAVPVVSLPGRGVSLSLNFIYNSQLWIKSTGDSTFYYDMDGGFPAPGFSFPFPRLVQDPQPGDDLAVMLVEPDGTRHPFQPGTSCLGLYDLFRCKRTTDGSFIDYEADYEWDDLRVLHWRGGWVAYPDGSWLYFGRGGYPTRMEDTNGNFLSIIYVGGPYSGKIQRIRDTLGRDFTFLYDTGRLTAIQGPDLATGTTRTLIRFHYATFAVARTPDDHPFVTGWSVNVPSGDGTAQVVDAIYYPATGTGYWFGDSDSYSRYGMLRKVVEQRGMGFQGDVNGSAMGTISQATPPMVTRQRVYYYPTVAQGLSDVPAFGQMDASWERGEQTPGSATVLYQRFETNPRQVVTTNPDSTQVVQYSVNNPGAWNDGLVTREDFLDSTPAHALRRQTLIEWFSTTDAPLRSSVTTYDLESGETLKLYYGLAGNWYFNQPKSINYLLLPPAQPPISLRYVVFTPLSDPGGNYASAHIFNLFQNVEVFDSDAQTHRLSKTDYAYDAPLLTECTTNVNHDGVGPYRGNVTQITRYAQADGTPSGPITETRTYDTNGNMVRASPSCCEQTKYTYTTDYACAYPTPIRRGAPDPNPPSVTTSAVYNFNTGVPLSSTDANNQTTQFNYFAGSIRLQQTTLPPGGRRSLLYDDANLLVTSTDSLTGTDTAAQVKKRFTGLGQLRRQEASAPSSAWDVTEMKYDSMGRLNQQSLPFRNQADEKWTFYSYDDLGRVTAVTADAPDNGVIHRFYNEKNADGTPRRPTGALSGGHTVRVQDAWGSDKWSLMDTLGRLMQVAEADPVTGSVFDSNAVLTNYTFNGLDLLTNADQGVQHRVFQYDSLGRLLRQKLPEKRATLNDLGVYQLGGNGLWTDVFGYDQRSNLTSHTDARGVITQYLYNNDALNRLQTIHYDSTSNFGDTANPVVPTADITYQYRTGAADLTQVSQVSFGVAGDFPGGHEFYGYDNVSRLGTKTQSFNGLSGFDQALDYSYDALNRLWRRQYPAQYGLSQNPRKNIDSAFDAASRVSGILVDTNNFASNVTYTAYGQPSSLNIGPSGPLQVTETNTYDLATGLLTTQLAQRGSTYLLQLDYDYSKQGATGATGQLSKITNHLDAKRNRAYSYDGLGRLIAATGGDFVTPAWTETYGYDRYGNRTSVKATGTAADGTPIPLDGLPGLSYESTSNHVTTDTYDAEGNVVCGQKDAVTWLGYQYDAAGRLAVVNSNCQSLSQRPLESYGYGMNRHRIASKDATTGLYKYYVWNGEFVIAEYSQQGSNFSWSKGYIHLGTRLLATLKLNPLGAESIEFDHPDRLGTRLMSHSTSSDVQEQVTLPFGTSIDAESSGSTNQRFTSYDRSSVTGLDYAVNRIYEFPQGRFTQPDPIAMAASNPDNPQSFNLYSYVGNDPVNAVDPSGTCSDDTIWTTTTWFPDGTVTVTYRLEHGTPCLGAYDGLGGGRGNQGNNGGEGGLGNEPNVVDKPAEICSVNPGLTLPPPPEINLLDAPSSQGSHSGLYYVARWLGFDYQEAPQTHLELGIPFGPGLGFAGIYDFVGPTGARYVGQSSNILTRLGTWMRSGRLLPENFGTVNATKVAGGRTAREIAEQQRVNEFGGVKNLENIRNPIGPNRQHLMKACPK